MFLFEIIVDEIEFESSDERLGERGLGVGSRRRQRRPGRSVAGNREVSADTPPARSTDKHIPKIM